MNLINKDCSAAISDLKTALYILKHSTDLDEKLDAYTGLTLFKNNSSRINNKQIHEIYRELNSLKTSRDLKEISYMQKEYVMELFKNYQSNERYIKRLFKRQQALIDKENKYFITQEYTPMSANEIYKIIAYYYLDNDNESLSILNELIKKKNILDSDSKCAAGQTIICKTFDNDYIGIVERYSFYTMMVLVHEIAHTKRIRNLKEHSNYNSVNRYIRQNDFLELHSNLAEKKFLKYLINNGCNVEEAVSYQLTQYIAAYSRRIDYLVKDNNGVFKQHPNDILNSLKVLYGNFFSNLIMKNDSTNIEDWDYNLQFINQDIIEQTFSNEELIESALYPLEQAKKLVK